jgi:hypothetical protein
MEEERLPEGLILKKNVLYVILRDMQNGTTLAKLLNISGSKSFKPTNNPAALLLYILARDDDDPVSLDDLKFYARKFSGSADTIDNDTSEFCKLLNNYKLLKKTPGTDFADRSLLDPANLFTGLDENWQMPGLTTGDAPIVKATTVISTGYGAVPIRR